MTVVKVQLHPMVLLTLAIHETCLDSRQTTKPPRTLCMYTTTRVTLSGKRPTRYIALLWMLQARNISAEVNQAVSQRTAQYSAFAQSLHAETVVAENSEKAVGEQRDSILAESHAMQDTINGLNDTVERLRSDLERAQREMVRRDPQPASSFQNVSSESFLDKRGSIFDDVRLFPTQNAQTSGPMPQIIPQQSWTDPISGAMQFDTNEHARRSLEQENSRSQQNQPTNQPNVERLTGPETTGAEFRAALLGFVRNQHDRPKAKEADSLRLSEFPTPETYRAWKTATREEIRAASDHSPG